MQADTSEHVSLLARLWSRQGHRQQVLVLAAGLGVAAAITAVFVLRGGGSVSEYFRALGYPGLFVLSLMGSASIIFPVPSLLGVCGAGGIELNFLAVGLISGAGEAIGEMSGYAAGYGGRTVIERRSFYRKLSRWMERRGTLVLFLVSVIPNPFFDLVGVAAGGTRFPLGRFMGAVMAGKATKNVIVAYACLQGIRLLPWAM